MFVHLVFKIRYPFLKDNQFILQLLDFVLFYRFVFKICFPFFKNRPVSFSKYVSCFLKTDCFGFSFLKYGYLFLKTEPIQLQIKNLILIFEVLPFHTLRTSRSYILCFRTIPHIFAIESYYWFFKYGVYILKTLRWFFFSF